jgi:heme A synthase
MIGLLALQGAVGGLQWELKLPTEIVWVHVALATVTWLAMLWTVATAGRLEPRDAAAPAAEASAAGELSVRA